MGDSGLVAGDMLVLGSFRDVVGSRIMSGIFWNKNSLKKVTRHPQYQQKHN
jgi:hypothetical protein